MRILVTGGNGQLGNELQRILREGRSEIGPIPDAYAGAEVVATDVDELDVTDADAVMAFVAQGGFDLIVNGAAMTNVDGCETAEDAAFRVNAEAPGNLARAAEAAGAKFVQVSTDYVFPGTEPEPRVEDDPTGPVSAYGRTKLAGEERSLEACSRCFVVRTAWLYGYVGKNFVKTMMRLGADRDEVTVVDDQLGNPTSANDLAHEILKIAATENYGVYHCTERGNLLVGRLRRGRHGGRGARLRRHPLHVGGVRGHEPRVREAPGVLVASQQAPGGHRGQRDAPVARRALRVLEQPTRDGRLEECQRSSNRSASSSPAEPGSSEATSSTGWWTTSRTCTSSCWTRSPTPATCDNLAGIPPRTPHDLRRRRHLRTRRCWRRSSPARTPSCTSPPSPTTTTPSPTRRPSCAPTCAGTFTPAGGRAPATTCASTTSPPTRSTATSQLDDPAQLHGGRRPTTRPSSPYSSTKAIVRHAGARVGPHLRSARPRSRTARTTTARYQHIEKFIPRQITERRSPASAPGSTATA